MGPRHSFWNVLGPADAPMYSAGKTAARTAADRRTARGDDVSTLIGILGEANRIAGLCGILFARMREDSGLSGVEVLTLIAIAHAQTPQTVPQVGRTLGHPRQVIQRAARELARAGLIELAPNPGHKRALLLVATPEGQRMGDQIDAETAAIVSVLARDADSAALHATLGGLAALRGRIDDYLKTPGQ